MATMALLAPFGSLTSYCVGGLQHIANRSSLVGGGRVRVAFCFKALNNGRASRSPTHLLKGSDVMINVVTS